MITKERSVEIAETYYKDVLDFCRAELKNESDAEDITQEVFLLFQSRYTEMDDINIKSWLFNVAQKKISERFRDIKKRSDVLLFDENADYLNTDSFIAEINESMFMDDEEIEHQKFKILEKLTPEERELFKMIYIRHLKYAEIAEISGISENAVSIRALRMRNKIKKAVSEVFVTALLIVLFFIFF